MTKRALSLLLTLVMVLSLCVPALAAEDFEAEAPAEVVEEAPEAPEAPVAPEAEEPADEPVVDEPAAEEPVEEAVAEDAPEMASVLPEDAEDLPYLVALGVVSKYNHYVLEKTLKVAESYKTKVDNDELYVKSDYEKISQTKSPAKSFLEAYETAKKNLDGINGVVVDIDVTDASVEAAVHELERYFSEDDGGNGEELLVSTLKDPNGDNDYSMNKDKLLAGLNVNKTYNEANTAGTSAVNGPKYQPNNATAYYTLSAKTDTKFDTEKWTNAYKSEYLNALKTAQAAINTFVKTGRSAEYKDFATARKAVLAAAKLEYASTVPTSGDTDALKAAIKKVEAVGADAYNKSGDLLYARYDANLFAASGALARAKDLLSDTLGLNGLKTYVRYEDVKMAIRDLTDALTLKKNTFKVESYKLATPDTFEITVSIAKIGDNPKDDGYTYGYAIKCNDLWYRFGTDTGEDTFNVGAHVLDIAQNDGTTGTHGKWQDGGNDYPGRLVTTLVIENYDKDGKFSTATPFTKDDKVTVYFYVKNVKKNEDIVPGTPSSDSNNNYIYGSSFVNQALSIGTNTYFGPTMKDAWVNDYGELGTMSKDTHLADLWKSNGDAVNGNKFTDYQAIIGNDIMVAVTMSAPFGTWAGADYVNYKLTVKNAKGNDAINEVYGQWGGGVDPNKDMWTVNKTTDGTVRDDTYLVAGTMKAAIDEKLSEDDLNTGHTTTHTGSITRTSMDFTIAPLSKWGSVKQIKKILEEAKALVQSDYNALNWYNEDLGCVNGRPDITSVQAAFQTINNDVKLIESYINDSTKANSQYNRQIVADALVDLGTVYKYLAYKPVTVEQLNELISECRPITDDDYTYDSWGVFVDALTDAEEVLVNYDPALQSEVDKAYADLKAAYDGLTKEGAVNKTALEAAIASAKALVEADYTPESWAANKATIDAAIEAAQAVVDNANATQAQVNTALNTLTAAVAKLEKVATPEEGPKAPTSNNGTGWVLYDGTWYFFKNGKMVQNYWVGKIDGASQWDSNWYYVGADGKMATGMQYIDDLHGGYGWYFLQPTNTKGEIGKMLTGWQWVGGAYGECYFSTKNGSSGKCTWSELLGNWNGTTWVK